MSMSASSLLNIGKVIAEMLQKTNLGIEGPRGYKICFMLNLAT